MEGDKKLSRDNILQEADAVRLALQNSAEPAERTRLKARYAELDQLMRSNRDPKQPSNSPLGSVSTQKCPFCAEEIKADAKKCRFCGEFLDASYKPKDAMPALREVIPSSAPTLPPTVSTSIPANVALGVAGSLALFTGVFVPLIRVPLVGTQNYIQNGEGDGIIIIVFAALSLVLSLTRLTRWLYIPSLFSLSLVGFTFYRFRVALTDVKDGLDSRFDGLGDIGQTVKDISVQSIQMEWGWAILIVACILLFASSALTKK